MKLSVKKFSKKSLSLLIALIMVFSALPLTPPISADAATTTTLNKDSFGMLTNGDTSRFPNNNKFNIVNDRGSNNTSAGLLHYDLSPFADTNISTVTFNVTIDSFLDEPNIDYVNFYYSTTINNASTYLSEKGVENKNLGWGNGAGNKAVTDYSSNLGFNANQILYLQKFETSKSNVTGSKDVTSIFKNIILSGAKDLYIIIMHNTAGDANNNNHWSDTTITPANINFTVTYSDYDFSNPTQAKEYIDSRINGFAMPTTQTVSYYGTDLGISNVLYTSNTFVDSANSAMTDFTLNNKPDDTKVSAKLMAGVGRIVYMYTGDKTVAKIPLVYESKKNASTLQTYRYNYITSANSTWTFGNSNWIRSTARNAWDTASGSMDGAYTVSSASNHNVDDFSDSNKPSALGDASYDFHNIATYNGSVSFTNNYMKFNTTPSIDMSLDGYCSWKEGVWPFQSTKFSYQNNITKNTPGLKVAVPTLSTPNNTSYSMIDFSGYNALVSNNTMKNKYKEVKDNETKYTDDSLLAYYKAVANLVKFKTSNYDLSKDSGVTSCASDLATVVNNYNKAERELAQKTVSVNFLDVTLYPKKTLNVTPGTTIYESDLPALTKPTYSQNNKHNIYYWGYSDGTAFTVPFTVNADIDVEERLRTENCKLKVKSIDGNTSTVSCSVCNGGTYTLDIKAYRDIVSVAQEAINDEAKYDSDSRANLQKVLNDNTVNDCITIKQVDAKISAIQTAINELVLNKYSITVKYVDENGNDLAVGEKGATYKTYDAVDYGTIQNIVAPTSYDGKKYIVYKWTRDIQGNNTISGLNSSSIGVVVKDAAQYYVYLKKASLDSAVADSSVIVKLNNRSNKVMDVGCVVKGAQTVTITGNKITLTDSNPNPNSVTLTAPNYSFYTLSGFKINGKTVQPGSTVKIDSETVIEPVYTPKDTITITVGSGVAGGNVSTSWDSRVKLTSTLTPTDSQLIKWTANINGANVVWGYGETLSFQATQSCTVRCELISKNTASPSVSVDYVSYNLYKANTITAVSRIAVPEGYTVVEYGTILKTSNNLNSNKPSLSAVESATYKKTNAGGVFKATQQITGTNQFAMNFFAATDYEEMYVGAVAYLVYKQANSNTEYVIYSNTNGGKVVTSSYNKTAVGNN